MPLLTSENPRETNGWEADEESDPLNANQLQQLA